jgi:pimeloyl-ACP methyl ester carboxylesterase
MNGLNVKRATLMGCSSGSLLAMEFALDHPDRVSALVLVGPIISGFEFSAHFRTRGGRGMPQTDATVEEEIAYWTLQDPWIMDKGSAVARKAMRDLLKANPHNLKRTGPRGRPPDQPVRGRLPKIAVPTLLVVGESDIPDVHTHIGVIQSGIQGAERIVLAHSGHLCHMEVPEAFNQTVLRFLKTLHAPQG